MIDGASIVAFCLGLAVGFIFALTYAVIMFSQFCKFLKEQKKFQRAEAKQIKAELEKEGDPFDELAWLSDKANRSRKVK